MLRTSTFVIDVIFHLMALRHTEIAYFRRSLISLTRGCQGKKEKCKIKLADKINITSLPPPPHHNRFTALFPNHLGEPVPEENFWTLWCKERLTEADTMTIRLGATPSGLTSAHLHHPPPYFYRPDALPAAQPTASKY